MDRERKRQTEEERGLEIWTVKERDRQRKKEKWAYEQRK
jgi:hypothetical protein